jgi:cytochrome P450
MSAPRSIGELPGPRGLPLLGSAHQLARASQAHLKAEAWARRYGPIVRVDIGPRRIIGISDAQEINRILRERPHNFRRWRDQETIFREMKASTTGDLSGAVGVVAAEGEEWKRQRRLVVTALNSNHLHRYFHVIRTAAGRLRVRLEQAAQAERAFEITQDLCAYTVDVTSALAFGVDLNTLERGENELQSHIQRALQMTARRLAMPVRYWRWVRLPADRALDRSMLEIRKAVLGFIEQAKARMVARPELYEKPENFLEGMLAAQRADGAITDEEIIANVSTLLNAGEDTTAHTLAWTVWFLASRPQILERLAEEARSVLGGGELPADHTMIEQLDYCEAVIRESMRLKTVGPLLTLEPLVDTTICDTHIPAGTRLLLLLRQAGLHDGEHASEFRPERWLNQQDDESAPKSLAFGAGPRFCPGRNLAFLESKAAIAMIARNFTIELDDSHGAVREAFHFAMVPKGLRVRLHERSSAGQAAASDSIPKPIAGTVATPATGNGSERDSESPSKPTLS